MSSFFEELFNIRMFEKSNRPIRSRLYFCGMQDSFKHKGMRNLLIDELRKDQRITNQQIFTAFQEVPRHFFLDKAFVERAYSNTAFQIGAGQTISHPITVAFQTQLLEVKPGDKILEIGTGSGFQTCILYALGANMFSIERQQELFVKSRPLIEKIVFMLREQWLKTYNDHKLVIENNSDIPKDQKKEMLLALKMKYRKGNQVPRLSFGDGYKGIPAFAPFDKIIVTCGAPEIPQALIEQVKVGGIIVIPVGEGKEQTMKRAVKISETELEIEEYGTFKFVPMLEDTEKKK